MCALQLLSGSTANAKNPAGHFGAKIMALDVAAVVNAAQHVAQQVAQLLSEAGFAVIVSSLAALAVTAYLMANLSLEPIPTLSVPLDAGEMLSCKCLTACTAAIRTPFGGLKARMRF